MIVCAGLEVSASMSNVHTARVSYDALLLMVAAVLVLVGVHVSINSIYELSGMFSRGSWRATGRAQYS